MNISQKPLEDLNDLLAHFVLKIKYSRQAYWYSKVFFLGLSTTTASTVLLKKDYFLVSVLFCKSRDYGFFFVSYLPESSKTTPSIVISKKFKKHSDSIFHFCSRSNRSRYIPPSFGICRSIKSSVFQKFICKAERALFEVCKRLMNTHFRT